MLENGGNGSIFDVKKLNEDDDPNNEIVCKISTDHKCISQEIKLLNKTKVAIA